MIALDFIQRGSAGQDHGEDVKLADAPRNELRVLRAEVEDNDGLGVHVTVWQAMDGAVKANRGATFDEAERTQSGAARRPYSEF